MIEKNAPKKIFIVDDDREWNLVLRLRLEKEGYLTKQIYDGLDAIDKIKGERPDLVLLDIGLPGADGWNVCGALRNEASTKDLPIIILSSFTRPEDILQGKTYQVKRYLLKPCSIETVVQNVREIFEKKN